jgi:hypothetical protein
VIEQAIEEAVARHVAPLEARIAELVRIVNERLPARWLTRREAAEQLDCSVDKIDRMIKAGDPAIEVQQLGETCVDSRGRVRRTVRIRLVQPTSAVEIAKLAREARAR